MGTQLVHHVKILNMSNIYKRAKNLKREIMSDSSSTPSFESSILNIRLKRRGFLGSLLGGATALVLQACGKDPQTPPILPRAAEETLLPTASATGEAVASSTPLVAPTVIPPPSPSALLAESETYLPIISKPQAAPTPSDYPEPFATVTAEPEVSPPPAPTRTPKGTTVAEATTVTEPTLVVESTNTPPTSETAGPSHTPEPVTTTEPSQTPEPSHTPEPTVAPQPTATATLPPTPIPPGPSTKLGLFVGHLHPTLEQLLRTKNVPFVKTLEYDPDLMEFIKQISPNTTLVARYTPLGELNWGQVDPIAEARRFVNLLLPIATEPKRFRHIDAWESYNEPVPNSPAAMQRYATFEAERTRLLAQEGIRSCVGNFATGTPELALWPDFLSAVQAVKEHNGFLGLHEYSAPYMWFGSGPYQLEPGVNEGDEGWLTLRYRKVYRQYLQPAGLEVPLLITEMGIDGQVAGRPGPPGLGWLDFQEYWQGEGQVRTTTAAFYMEQLAWYDAELLQDAYVKGASIFILGATPGWETFELIGGMADILQEYFSVHPRR